MRRLTGTGRAAHNTYRPVSSRPIRNVYLRHVQVLHIMPSTSTAPLTAESSTTTPALFDDERAGKIYRVAAQMIHRRGFASTSMAHIADAVTLTKPGLYYYVKGKKELLFSIMRYAMDLLDREVMERAAPLEDPEQRLRAIVGHHAHLLMRDEHGALGILIDEVAGLADEQRVEIIRRKRRYFDFVRDTIAALHGRRGLTSIDPTVAAFSVLGMIMWLSRWYDAAGPLPRDTVAENITEIALAGVLAGGEPPVAVAQSLWESAADRAGGPALRPVPATDPGGERTG